MLVIDDITFNAEWEYGNYTQTAEIMNGSNAGRLQNTAEMYLDPIGTFFNSTGTILKGGCNDSEWDSLFRVLCDPMGEHTVKIPFDQGYMTTKIYISSAQRTLIKRTKERNIWSKKFKVTFTAMESEWLAGKSLTNYRVGV